MPQFNEHIDDQLQESVAKFLAHDRSQIERSVRKALGLKPNDPLPASGGEFPKMVFHRDYFHPSNSDEDRAKNTDVIESVEDEKNLDEGWYATLDAAKKAAEEAGTIAPVVEKKSPSQRRAVKSSDSPASKKSSK